MTPPPPTSPEPAPALLLYDGVCGLCNGVVAFLLPRDRAARLRFAPLQSELARGALSRHGRTATTLDTVYLLERHGTADERLAAKSTAALRAVAMLGGPWRLARALLLIPRPVRDAAYDVIARMRYRLFGKHAACPVPPPAWRGRFLA